MINVTYEIVSKTDDPNVQIRCNREGGWYLHHLEAVSKYALQQFNEGVQLMLQKQRNEQAATMANRIQVVDPKVDPLDISQWDINRYDIGAR